MASLTAAPSPSSTRPSIRRAPGVSGGTRWACGVASKEKEKNGPTVCEGVVPSSSTSGLHGRRVAATQDDVEAVGKRPLGLGRLEVERAHEPLPGPRIPNGLEDRVVVEERVTREVH